MADANDSEPMLIAIVGPCASGKSTLARALRAAGYQTTTPVQEHSAITHLWQRSQPDLLIYLDIDFAALLQRRPKTHGGPARLATQNQRLTHAYNHYDLYVDTSDLTPIEVQEKVFAFLEKIND